MSTALDNLSIECGKLLLETARTVTTAESCTGGWIAQCLTSVPGSSGWFETGFVTYSNAAKQRLLAVPSNFLEGDNAPGAVSDETVRAMAKGALDAAGADIAVATSGIAGPDGGSDKKPVGTVWIGWAWLDPSTEFLQTETAIFHFKGDRKSVREQAVSEALAGVVRVLKIA